MGFARSWQLQGTKQRGTGSLKPMDVGNSDPAQRQDFMWNAVIFEPIIPVSTVYLGYLFFCLQ